MTNRAVVVLCVLASPLIGYGEVASDAAPRVTIKAAGGDSSVWLIRSSSRGRSAEALGLGSNSLVNVFASQAVGGAKLEPVRVTPEVGWISRCAASGQYLFVFFDDGTHRSYAPDGRRIEIDLPERAVPLALAGMVGERERPRIGVYAVVRHRVANAILRRERDAAAATRPTAAGTGSRRAPTASAGTTEHEGGPSSRSPDTREARKPVAAALPQIGAPDEELAAGRYLHILAYEGGRWQYVTQIEGLPEGFEPHRLWLCATPRAIYVFSLIVGADGNGSTLVCLCWLDGRWMVLPSLELGGFLEYGEAMYLEPRVAFGGAMGTTGAAGRASQNPGGPSPVAPDNSQQGNTPIQGLTWRLWSLVDDQWRAGEPLVFDPQRPGALNPKPGRTTVAAFGQNVFVATVAEGGEIEVGLWPADGGTPKRPLEATRVFDLPRKPLIDAQTRDWLALFVVLGIVVLVFWKRQESLSTPAALPKGVTLAAYWKRLAGAMIDLLPATAATAWIWYAPVATYYHDLSAAGAAWKEYVPPAPDRLLLGWLLLRVVYAIYCAVFERLWGATPGKWLVGSRVLTEAGKTPAMRDVVIRNAMRILELEPYLPIWPLLLIVLFTRNRQRLGDLLARTVVVEPREAASSPDSDNDDAI